MARERSVDKEDEISNIFYIPANFTDSGRIFQGMFEVRNVVEAVVFGGGIGWLIWNLFPLEVKMRVMLVALIACPVGVVALLGYHGDCMTRVIQSVYVFIKDRRKMRFRRIRTDGTQKDKTSTGRGKNRGR